MQIKNIGIFAIFFLFIFSIFGCASFTTANSNKWLEYQIPPSRIENASKTIMDIKLSDGSICYVMNDRIRGSDAEYYYSILMQDFGWRSDGDYWRGGDRRTKLGYIYINPSREVAIYMWPEGSTYSVYKLKFN